jgi:hypothetical protein
MLELRKSKRPSFPLSLALVKRKAEEMIFVHIQHLFFKEIRKIIYSEAHTSNHYPGTWIQVTVGEMFHCGRGDVILYGHRTKESHESMYLQTHWWSI